jgi:hypothetical protein
MAKDWLFAIFSMRRDPARPTKIQDCNNKEYEVSFAKWIRFL